MPLKSGIKLFVDIYKDPYERFRKIVTLLNLNEVFDSEPYLDAEYEIEYEIEIDNFNKHSVDLIFTDYTTDETYLRTLNLDNTFGLFNYFSVTECSFPFLNKEKYDKFLLGFLHFIKNVFPFVFDINEEVYLSSTTTYIPSIHNPKLGTEFAKAGRFQEKNIIDYSILQSLDTGSIVNYLGSSSYKKFSSFLNSFLAAVVSNEYYLRDRLSSIYDSFIKYNISIDWSNDVLNSYRLSDLQTLNMAYSKATNREVKLTENLLFFYYLEMFLTDNYNKYDRFKRIW